MQTKDDLDLLCVNAIRTLSMDAVQAVDSGHPGAPMALAPVAYRLWQRFLRFDPQDPISYTFRFGDNRPLSEKESPSSSADSVAFPQAGEWAFLFNRKRQGVSGGPACVVVIVIEETDLVVLAETPAAWTLGIGP